nr:MAG TPA: AAA domain protein [Caudoviricetes sp.]
MQDYEQTCTICSVLILVGKNSSGAFMAHC